ncbi:MAG: hypothetical protein WBV81_03885 [Ignavibacteriaceae bacterium]
MSYTYRINRELKLNYVKANGSVSGEQVIRTAQRMFIDPDWKYVRKQISDFREAKELIITFQDFEKIIEVEKEQQSSQEIIHNGEKGKLAIVAEKEIYDIVFRLYSIKTKDGFHDTRIFNTMDEAIVWLDLPLFEGKDEKHLKENFPELKNSKN